MALAFHVLCFSFFAGIVLSFLYYVPTTLYTVPYILWLGFQHNKGQYKDIDAGRGIWKDVWDATKVYAAWTTRRKPVLK